MKKIIGLVSLVVLSLSTISCSKDEDPFDYACVDLDKAESLRRVWGNFRDRRTDLYKTLLDLDGSE